MLLDQLKSFKPYSISPGYSTDLILNSKKDGIIENTTYNPPQNIRKALEGLIMHDSKSKVFRLEYEQSLLFTLNNQFFIEYHIPNKRFMVASVNSYSCELYSLLCIACNYIYNEKQIDTYRNFYENWRQINMQESFHDANEYKSFTIMASFLKSKLESIIQHNDFIYLHYDSVQELLDHHHLSFEKENLIQLYFYHQDPNQHLLDLKKKERQLSKLKHTIENKLDILPLFSENEIKELPLFLQYSCQSNKSLFLENRDFLDQNDFDLIRSFYRGKTWSCLYYGPSGTGKTTKLLCLAGALNLPSLKIVGSRSVDEATLFGKYVLRDGQTIFEYGPLALMMKYGGLFIFDEINMVDSDILSSLNDVLDGTKQKILDNGEIIHAHKNFRFAESMNIGYTGTNEMNLSHKSRIQNKIKLAKLSTQKMTGIIVKETGIDEKTANQMASLLDAFSTIIRNEGNETTMRIDLRTLINWANKTMDLDGDIIRASLVTIIAELVEEDEEISQLEDPKQILESTGPASTVMDLLLETFHGDA